MTFASPANQHNSFSNKLSRRGVVFRRRTKTALKPAAPTLPANVVPTAERPISRHADRLVARPIAGPRAIDPQCTECFGEHAFREMCMSTGGSHDVEQ